MSRSIIVIDGKSCFTDTGELVPDDTMLYIPENFSDIKQKSDAIKKAIKRDENQISVLKNHGEFYFLELNKNEVKLLNLDISELDVVRVIYLGTFANEDGLLLNDNGLPMNRKDIERSLKISKNTMPIFELNMLKSKILSKTNDGYFLSKKYLFKGKIERKTKSKTYVKLFIDMVRALYVSNPREYMAFEFAISLFPKLRYGDCYIYHNPKEQNEDKLVMATIRELLHEYNPEHRKQVLDRLVKFKFGNGEYLFGIGLVGSTNILDGVLMVNPKIAYFGDASNMSDVVKMFDEKVRTENNQNKFLHPLE